MKIHLFNTIYFKVPGCVFSTKCFEWTGFISKFEKNFNRRLDYQFMNAFPKSITSLPVSYGNADLLKVSVSFNYDRYIMDIGRINNLQLWLKRKN